MEYLPPDLHNWRKAQLLPGRKRSEFSSSLVARDVSAHPMSPEPQFRTIADYCETLWQRKWFLLAVTVLCTGTLFAVLRTIRPVYRATASVVFRKPVDARLGETPPVVDITSMDATFQTQVELFQSRTLVKKVTEYLQADRKARNTDIDREELQFIQEHLKVAPTRGTRLIAIHAESHDPKLAAEFANAIVREYIADERESEWKQKQESGQWLTDKAATLRQNLEAAEQALVAYASNNGLTPKSDKGETLDPRINRLQDELAKARVERFNAEARYEMASKTSPESLSEVLESPTLRDYQTKLTELQRQLAEASSLWTPNHYKVKQLKAQIDVVGRELEKERKDATARVGSDFTSAVRREQLLASEYLKAVRAVTDEANKAVHYNLLKRDVDRNRELYDGVIQRAEQVGLTSGLKPTMIHLIDAAEPPSRPQRPNVALLTYLGLVGSTFTGIVAVLFFESLRPAFRQPGEAAMYLNVTELGSIPSQKSVRDRSAAFSLRGSNRRGGSNDVELAAWYHTDSLTAHSFRATLASILFSDRSTVSQRIRTIVVTSSAAREGKTTVVSNLGLGLARMGRRVLIIDADYQKPRLHKIFGLEERTGLRELIEGTVPSLSSAVEQTAIGGLFLMQSGRTDSKFPEILESSALADVVMAARAEFDFVLIDTPPLLPLPDARIWGRMADGVVLVIRAGQTHRQRVFMALSRLADDGVPVLGAVLNDWDPRSSPYYSYANVRRPNEAAS